MQQASMTHLVGDTAPATTQPAQAPSGPMPQGEQASPEEQAQYEQFIDRAFSVMYDQKMLPKLKKMLSGEGEPKEGLARTAAMVTARVATAARKGGAKLSGDVLFHAGKAILEDLAEYSTKAGIHDYQQDTDALEGAYFLALDHFRAMLQDAGMINQEAAQQDMKKIVDMDQRGELEQMLSGLDQADGGQKPAPEREEQQSAGGLARAARRAA